MSRRVRFLTLAGAVIVGGAAAAVIITRGWPPWGGQAEEGSVEEGSVEERATASAIELREQYPVAGGCPKGTGEPTVQCTEGLVPFPKRFGWGCGYRDTCSCSRPAKKLCDVEIPRCHLSDELALVNDCYQCVDPVTCQPTKREGLGYLEPKGQAQRTDGARELVEVPARDVLCDDRSESFSNIDKRIQSVDNRIKEAGGSAVHRLGVIVEQAAPQRWRVCLGLAAPVAGSERLAGGSVARLWHRGDYGRLSARYSELMAQLQREGKTVAKSRRTRLYLFVDPLIVKSPTELVSSIEVPID